MKNNSLLMLFFGIIFLLFFISCNKDEEPNTFIAEGYIVGFDPCQIPYDPGDGLLIFTEQDSMVTYHYPEEIIDYLEVITDYPDEFIDDWPFKWYFPNELKIKFRYRKVEGDELFYSVCKMHIPVEGFHIYSKNQIIIIQAESIE